MAPTRLALCLWALILTGLPALVSHLSAPVRSGSPPVIGRAVATPGAITPPPPPPPVGPAEFMPVAPADARAINAAIPFSTALNPAARPFRFAGDDTARDRAVDCLAAVQLYEAGDDPAGQRAVAQVVLNRLRHPAFPKTVCGVVFQGSERATGCQFTFTCDGSLARPPLPAAWQRARSLAVKMLAGTVDSRVGHATHYHTDWVVPYWSSSLDKITSVGTHLFFRWKGYWGTPPAFRRSAQGGEPAIPPLAFLSPAHRGDGNPSFAGQAAPFARADFADLGRSALTIRRDDIGDRFGPGRLAGLNSTGNAFIMILDRTADPAAYDQLARRMCAGRARCRLLGWTRASDAPNGFPVDDESLWSMSYAYIRATDSGLERSLYNCREFPGRAENQCMRDRAPKLTPPNQSSPLSTYTPARSGTEVLRLSATPPAETPRPVAP